MGGAINPRPLYVFMAYASTNLLHFKFVYIILKLHFSHYFVVMFVNRSNGKDHNIPFQALSNSITCRLIAKLLPYNIQLSVIHYFTVRSVS